MNIFNKHRKSQKGLGVMKCEVVRRAERSVKHGAIYKLNIYLRRFVRTWTVSHAAVTIWLTGL